MALSSLRPCVKHQLSTSERNLATQQSHSDAANRAAALSGCLFLILERTNRNFVANTSDNVPLNSRNDANEVLAVCTVLFFFFLGPQCRDEQAGRGQSNVWNRAPLTVEDEPEKNEEDNLTDDKEEDEEEEEDDARSSFFSRDDSGDSGRTELLHSCI